MAETEATKAMQFLLARLVWGRILAGILLGSNGIGAGFGCSNMLRDDRTFDVNL